MNILTHMNQDGIWHGCARPRRPGSRLRFPRLVVTEGGICLYNREIEGHSLWAWAAQQYQRPNS